MGEITDAPAEGGTTYFLKTQKPEGLDHGCDCKGVNDVPTEDGEV